MDINLLDEKFLKRWREYIKNCRTKDNQTTREWVMANAGECPYKPIKTRGYSYKAKDGSYVQGLSYGDMAKLMGVKDIASLALWVKVRKLPRPDKLVLDKDGKEIYIYEGKEAQYVSKYLIYSYEKPSKLLMSYNEYKEENK